MLDETKTDNPIKAIIETAQPPSPSATKPQPPHPTRRDGLNIAKPTKSTGKHGQPDSEPSKEDDDPWGEPILFDQVLLTP